MTGAAARYTGEGRIAGVAGSAAPLTIVPGEGDFTFALGDAPVRRAAYRDLETVAVQQGTGLLEVGRGGGAVRLILERFGPSLGPLVTSLRERRLRQRMADRFAEIPDEQPVELVEHAVGPAPGAPPPGGSPSAVGQLALHPWGFVLAPLDERRPWVTVPRAELGTVTPVPAEGVLRIQPDAAPGIELRGLGPAVSRHHDALRSLRASAFADASAIVERLIPDASFAARDVAGRILVDGRPADREALGDAWGPIEAAVLSEPTFADSYRALLERAGGPGRAHRWIALAPDRPGETESPRAWFVVALPGNLVALELVSEGAHATYCFRVVSRGQYDGADPDAMLAPVRAAVAGISAALVDARFLREPIALPDDRLASPAYTRYRLALAALPSLAVARGAFVARLVHSSPEAWTAALDDLIRWHGSCRDDTAAWPGRAAQEAQIDGAGTGAGTVGAPG